MSVSELVIGADGFVGQRLQQMSGADGTSRRNPTLLPNSYYLDLLGFGEEDLPPAEIVYLCAGVNGAKTCEGNPESHRVNVDATLRIATHYRHAFVVWISSTTVEWSNSAYARQKVLAEMALRAMPHVAVIRAGRVTKSNLDDLCAFMLTVGRRKKAGLHLWGVDEKPYEK